MQQNQVILVIIVVVLAGGIGFWLGRASAPGVRPEESAMPSEPSLTIRDTTLTGGNAVAVNDQVPGMRVKVALVTLEEGGWVVIHEDIDGKPGRILGARRFDAGSNQSGEVELLRVTEEGRVYYAMLHRDDGDRQFDHAKDLPIFDPRGNVIMMRFVAQTQGVTE